MFNSIPSLILFLTKLGGRFTYAIDETARDKQASGKWRKTKHSLVSGITLVMFAVANRFTCLFCGYVFNETSCKDWQIDHLIGQTDLLESGYQRNSTIFNITLACKTCNAKKGNRLAMLNADVMAEHKKRVQAFLALDKDDKTLLNIGYRWSIESVKFAKAFMPRLTKMGKAKEVKQLHGLA